VEVDVEPEVRAKPLNGGDDSGLRARAQGKPGQRAARRIASPEGSRRAMPVAPGGTRWTSRPACASWPSR
jgi:hypothetical protein